MAFFYITLKHKACKNIDDASIV